MLREQESLEQGSLKMFFKILISEKQIRTCKPQSLREVHLLLLGRISKFLKRPWIFFGDKIPTVGEDEGTGPLSSDLYPLPVH